MSGDPMQEVHEKKIVRFTVSWLKEGELMNRSRKFKVPQAAVDHFAKMMLMGHKDVGLFKNTKIYKTERIL